MNRVFAAALALSGALLAAPPTVTKVEPPNWWPAHSINPVRLLIRGTNLCGARIESTFAAGRISYNSACTYLFADLTIQPNTPPGAYPLKVITSGGAASVPFTLTAPLNRRGRFQGFSPDDVVYLIMPDRFSNGDPSNDAPNKSPGLLERSNPRYYHGGDLQGIINRLPYLKDLGITAIWLNPVYDNNDQLNGKVTDYHGYGAVDLYAVDEHLGDVAKFRELVDAAHAHGIKIIQDQVANHTGPTHPWVQDPPTPAWFNGTAARHLANTWQTWTLMDPHASEDLRRATLDGWFINRLPDFNQDDPEVRQYLIQNTLWWVGMTGLDGIRQDTLPYVPRSFWRDWTGAIKREYPSLRVVGEVLDANPALVSFFQTGRAQFDGIDSGIDTLFDFPLYFAVRKVFAEGNPVRDVASVIAHDHLYPDASGLVTLLGLHDVERFVSAKGASLDGLKLAFTFLLTTRGTPLIYYGDEIGMPGGNDPDNRRDFPGGWTADARNAFENGRTPAEDGVFRHVRALLRLRAAQEPLRRGKLVQLFAADQQYIYKRTSSTGTAIVALNNAEGVAGIGFQAGVPAGEYTDQLGSAARLQITDSGATISLPPRSAAIFITPN